MKRYAFLAAMLLCPLGCESSADNGGDPSTSSTSAALDCGWIASNNCWKQALADIGACMPQPADQNGTVTTGALSSDQLSCDFGEGLLVSFDDPLLPFETDSIGVTLEQDGARCARFERELGSIRLETASGVVSVGGVMGNCAQCYSLTVSCPDGSSYTTDDFLSTMQSCEPDVSDWPATVVEQMAPSLVGLDLSGGPDGQTKLFSCSY